MTKQGDFTFQRGSKNEKENGIDFSFSIIIFDSVS